MKKRLLIPHRKVTLRLLMISLFLGLFCTSFTGAYRYDFYYQIKVVDSEGKAVSDKDFMIQKDESNFRVKTDSMGVLRIHLGGTENCTSTSHSRHIKDWSWTPSSLFIVMTNKKIDINKNWKKHFRRDKKKIDVFNFQSGEFSSEKRK